MATPIELPDIRCISCGKVIASKYSIYKELLEIGYSKNQIFQVINVERYCCRMRISNSPIMAAIYAEEPNSLINAKKDSLSEELSLSSIKEDKLLRSSIKYVAASLISRRTTVPPVSVILERQEKRNKRKMMEIDPDSIMIDSMGNILGDTPKKAPSREPVPKGESMFDVKIRAGTSTSVTTNRVIEIIDVGLGYQVPKLARIYHLESVLFDITPTPEFTHLKFKEEAEREVAKVRRMETSFEEQLVKIRKKK